LFLPVCTLGHPLQSEGTRLRALALLEQRAKLGRPTAASYRPIAGDVGLLTLRKT